MTGPASTPHESSLDVTAIRQQVERILASPGFGGAERRGRLLKYLVEKALSGEPVKEYGIGVDVFQKPPDYDPRLDPSVRVEIGRLRARLSQYYTLVGADAAIRIEIPKGSYVPVFETAPPEEPQVETLPPALEPPARSRRLSKRILIAVAGTLALAIAAVLLPRLLSRQTAIRSVVVLPFQNLTGDPHNDYLADGITEELTDALAQVSSLRVVARTSAMQFKGKGADIREIGRKVDADGVIEGSLASVEGKQKLTVQLNRAADGYHVFSRTFEGDPHDLPRLENAMAALVVSSLRPRAALMKRSAPDPEAYNLLLKARAYRGDGTREGSERATNYLHQAIERDPGYGDAYAALAGVYVAAGLNFATEPIVYANQARAAAAKALELNPDSAAAYAALGDADSLILLDWKRGEQELRKSIALMPNGPLGHNHLGELLAVEGRFSEAIPELQEAANLDPLVAAPRMTLGLAYFMSRNYDEALRRFTESRDLHPDQFVIHAFIGMAWVGKGQFDRAMQEYKIVEAKLPIDAPAYLAHLLALTGKRAEAIKLLKEMEHPADAPPNAFDVAAVYAALGDKDSAFRWLDLAFEQRRIWFLKVHPFLDPLRGDPRFRALLEKTGLNQVSPAGSPTAEAPTWPTSPRR